ncbi:MAG: glycosyl transferase [Desulfobacterales bacterium]|nr:glycosyl transferase [Desulfobacterales bacterium]
MGLILYPISAFAICLALTPLVRALSVRKGWMAYPQKERWHKKPTALLGGIAIFTGIVVPLFFLSDYASLRPALTSITRGGHPPAIATVISMGTLLLFMLGLIDDFIHIKPHTKLIGQILAASIVTFLGFRLQWVTSLTIDTTLTILWIIGITNAFNLLDNMDGLCAGIGLVAASYLAVLFAGSQPEAALVAMILAGSLAAFLFYNFNPASIFMGDCGSLLIGFTLAILGLHYSGSGGDNRLSAIAVPIMVLMVPIFDTTLVTLIRVLSGRKASVGGKDHTSHRLVLMGFSEKRAVLFLYGTAAVSGLAALFVSKTDTLTSPVVIIPLALSILLMGVYLAQLRVYPEKEFSRLRDRTFTPMLVELTYKRQMLLVLLDLFLIAFSYYLSYRLRFDSDQFPYYFRVFLQSLPAVIACKLLAFFAIGIYRGIWRYMGANDVVVYLKASAVASLLSVAVVTFIFRFRDFSKGIFIIDWVLTTGLLLGTRGSFRLLTESFKRKALRGDTVLIYGAGRGGEILMRELLNNQRLNIKPMGFIDDDPLKAGKKFQGYPVWGTFADLAALQKKLGFGGVLISYHHKDPEKFHQVVDYCRENRLFLKRFSIHIDDVDLES